VQQEHY